jgi:hypothetical protein
MTPIDDLARNLALRSPRGPATERIARAVAAPMSRRRALKVAAAASVTSFFSLRTGTAHAACPSCPQPNDPQHFTQFCGHPKLAGCLYVCCPPGDKCCQTDEAVTCCGEGYTCGEIVNGGYGCRCVKPCGYDCCKDNEDCIVPQIDDVPDEENPENYFCYQRCPYPRDHCDGTSKACCTAQEECCGDGCCTVGLKCCVEHGVNWCCGPPYDCGVDIGMCGCTRSQRCGSYCCPFGSTCCDAAQGCCGPTKFDDLLDDLGQFIGGAFGGASRASTARIRRDLTQLAASAGAAEAVVAIGAVADLTELAYDRIRSDRPDHAYRHAVRPHKPALSPIAAGPGLDAAAASALTKMLIAEARAWTLVYAAAVARARSLSALRARNRRAAVRQARASGAFAGDAAKALSRVPRLRSAAVAALRSAGTPEVTVTEAEFRAFQALVRADGLPADVRARLSQLGLRSAEQRQVAKLILARRPGTLAPNVLIAPLASASKQATLRKLVRELRQIGASSRKQPITRFRSRPRKVRAVRPHTSQAAGLRPRGGG